MRICRKAKQGGRSRRRRRTAGLTLVELVVAVFVFGVVMVGVVAVMLHILRSEGYLLVKGQMNSDAQRVASLLRNTLRLSSFSEMQIYTSNGVTFAVSYPVPSSASLPGAPDLDESGRVVWGETLILHLWPYADPSELRLTRFGERDNTMTISEREAAIIQIVQDGHGTNVAGDSSPVTRRLAGYAPSFNLRTDGRSYDFFASADVRDPTVSLGGVHLLPGENTLKFIVTGKNAASGGYGFRLDQLRLSLAGIPIEAEALYPPLSAVSGMATIGENPSSSWGDRRYLAFSAAAVDAEMELGFYNDTWHETTFLASGSSFSNCVTYLDATAGNVGTRLRAGGRDLAWLAALQTGTIGQGATNSVVMGSAVRAVVRGGLAGYGHHILASGDGCTVVFRASDAAGTSMRILAAFISEAADHYNPGSDIDEATTTRLRFPGPGNPKDNVTILSGDSVRTVPVVFPIDPMKSYVISYRMQPGTPSQHAVPWMWSLGGYTNRFDSYLIPVTSAPTPGDTVDALWSERGDVVPLAGIVGVSEIRTTYAGHAAYFSRIVDTRLTAPDFQTLGWSAITPPGTTVALRLRTGNDPGLADAAAWSGVGTLSAPGAIPLSSGDGRYAQVRVDLFTNVDTDAAPSLKYFELRWLGESAYVDIGGVFGKYPDGGIVDVFVNNEAPAASLRADLSLEGKTPLGGVLNWALGVEVSPRN